jgi:L-fuculose-phosphate aldolase
MSRSDPALVHPRDAIVATMERIYRSRMTTTSGGNLSVRDEDDGVWITPARLDKGALRRDDIVRVNRDGGVEGPHRPSSEFPFHLAIYRRRPDLGAIVHAHPVALVAFSICREVPDTALFPQARHVCGPVGYAPYALPGSERLGANIADVFARGHHCVLLENHGVVIGGADLAQAFQRFETLEFTAQTLIEARRLGPVRTLDEQEMRHAATARQTFPEGPPTHSPTAEKELRRQLHDFVRRGTRQRLMTSTEGTFSARLDADAFLITPYGVDRHAIDLEDLVVVRGGHREPGKQPSRAAALHQAIYRRHPQVQAIVNAIPVHATAFAVTEQPLEARTIPESFLFLGDVARVPFGWPYREPERVAELVCPANPVALLENDGVLVLGTSVLDAFDRLEVLETTAESLLAGRAVGELHRMGDDVIAELLAAFRPKV